MGLEIVKATSGGYSHLEFTQGTMKLRCPLGSVAYRRNGDDFWFYEIREERRFLELHGAYNQSQISVPAHADADELDSLLQPIIFSNTNTPASADTEPMVIADFTNNGSDVSYSITELTNEKVLGFDGNEKSVYNLSVVVPDFPDVSPATTYNIDVSGIELPEAGTPTIIEYSYTSRYKDNPATFGESYMRENATSFMGFNQVSFNYDYGTELAQLYAVASNLDAANFAGYYVIFNIKFWIDA